MKSNIKYLLFYFSICFFSCDSVNRKEPKAFENSDVIKPKFALNFSVQKKGELTILSIGEAWRDASEKFQYVLYPKGTKEPEGFKNSIKIAVPIERAICTGTTQLAFIDFLDKTDKIVAIANGKYVYHAALAKKISTGELPELGNDHAIDYEKALTLNPEIVFAFNFGRGQIQKKFSELGLPVVLISEFMEDTPLGRAEWAVFMSYFFGNESFALKKFNILAKNYLKLQNIAQNEVKKPEVLVGIAQEGSWFVPGGKSFIARFITDAGGRYLWADNSEKGGVPLDFESVLFKGQNADVWLNVVLANNKKQLKSADSRYSVFKAFKENNIYSYTARVSENGGYDFFESAIVSPDIVLADLIKIFHPKLLKEHELYYYKKLTD